MKGEGDVDRLLHADLRGPPGLRKEYDLIATAAEPTAVTAPPLYVAPSERIVSQICASMFGRLANRIVK